LKKLAAGDPRPLLEIYDELASNASTSLPSTIIRRPMSLIFFATEDGVKLLA
ncbi:hypothetical protein T09_2159, partial [Trichinella sp. T9]